MEPSPSNAAKTPNTVSNRQAVGPFPTDATETSYNGSDRVGVQIWVYSSS